MIASDARPLQFTLSDEPKVQLMFSPTQSCIGNQTFVSGLLNRSDDEKPLLIITDPTRSPRCMDIDTRDGTVNASIPVIGTTKNANTLTQDDFRHTGTVSINGRFFAPSRRHSIEEGVPQLQLADINIDVRSSVQFQRMRSDSFRRSFMTGVCLRHPAPRTRIAGNTGRADTVRTAGRVASGELSVPH